MCACLLVCIVLRVLACWCAWLPGCVCLCVSQCVGRRRCCSLSPASWHSDWLSCLSCWPLSQPEVCWRPRRRRRHSIRLVKHPHVLVPLVMKHFFLYDGVNGHGRCRESGRRSERRSVREPFHKFIRSRQVCHHSPCFFFSFSTSWSPVTQFFFFFPLQMARLASLDSVLPLQQISNSGGFLESIWWAEKCRTGQDLRLQFTYMSYMFNINWNRDKTFNTWCNSNATYFSCFQNSFQLISEAHLVCSFADSCYGQSCHVLVCTRTHYFGILQIQLWPSL